MNFHLTPGDSVTLVNRELRQRTIDFAIGPVFRLKLEQDLSAEILFDDQFVVMAGAESKWVRRRKFKLADLIDGALDSARPSTACQEPLSRRRSTLPVWTFLARR